MKVITTATLEDNNVDGLTVVCAELVVHGSKTRITLQNMGNSKPPFSLTLTINTADIQQAVMQTWLDDGR